MAQDNINIENNNNNNMDKPKPKARGRPKEQRDDKQPEIKNKQTKQKANKIFKKQKRQ